MTPHRSGMTIISLVVGMAACICITICASVYAYVLVEQACAQNADMDKDAKAAKDYPLYESPDYTDGNYIMIEFSVLDGSGTYFTTYVSIECVDVQLRTDAKSHTSLLCRHTSFSGSNCESATILVPLQEDVAVWQKEIDHWKAVRQAYIDSLPKPKRILPKQR